ncbi:serine/threonine protein kinase [Mycobacterium sp. SM1]|uniref:serine/threonine-protein kinase n=1 Tax=Mycobacterium sp. SM1 TaxID=2816243 RepID=UPI001BD154D8|nr:serine/threonine-protein kinase [Mycobacterium sp. SM1]MBS4726904.1 serine/threonine protein kinase [Mycobacterium sp. SM1]
MPLAPGATFAGYTILRMLGTGGAGEVYLAQHTSLLHRAALKVLPAEMTTDPEFRARFTRETAIATGLCHPHVVAVHHRGEFDGRLWIAMDYVEGVTAAQLMRERFPAGMPVGEALAIVTAIASALDYAHQRGMLHRDVKPANVFLTNPGTGEQRILLADFGIARPLGEAARRTAINLSAATVAYSAPEQLQGAGIDGRADQYALAATAFDLLTGAPPYDDANPEAVIGRHLSAQPPKLSDRHPELARLDGIMGKALAKNPAHRFDRCGQFADALNRAVGAGDHSPEAVRTAGYPDGTAPGIHAAAGGSPRHGVLARLGAAVTTPVPPGRWRSSVPGRAIAAAVLLFVLLVSLLVLGIERRSGTTSSREGAPMSGTSPASAAPSPGGFAGVPALLQGTYRIDLERTQETYNGTPNPQPPNAATWWAFRSSCTSTGCVARGIMLDENDHRAASTSAGGRPIVLDYQVGAWQSRPETLPFACARPDGTPAEEATTQVISLHPSDHGSLRGVMTVTVHTDECGQKGGRFVIPVAAERVGELPPGVTVPNPVPDTPTSPTTTRTR